MRPLSMVILVLALAGCFARAQNPSGHYEGAVSRDGSVQLVRADFDTAEGKLTGTFDIPELMDLEIAIPPAECRNDTLVLWLNYGNFLCQYFPKTDEITGISEKWLPKIRLHLKKGGQRVVHFRREEIAFDNKAVHLAGVLFIPPGKTPTPYVVLIHGSGSVDRNSAYYHSLGYALAERGIGVLLYDKRGCGKSSGDFQKATMSDLAGDAVAALKFLKLRKGPGVSTAGFLGTSQGGWISTIAANKSRECDFVILNVGPSVSVFHQEADRVKYSMMGDGLSRSAIDSALEYTDLYFRYTLDPTAGRWDSLGRFAGQVRKEQWVDYVNLPENKDDFLWWRNNNYDPVEDLKRMHCPVLSILAELDQLVPPAENQAKMDSLLRLSGIRYQIVVIPNVGHDELTYQGLNGSDWKWPDVYWQWRKRPEAILDTMVSWIRHDKSRNQ